MTKHKLVIEVTYIGSVSGAIDAARRVLDDGILQDAMRDHNQTNETTWLFRITDVEVKAT